MQPAHFFRASNDSLRALSISLKLVCLKLPRELDLYTTNGLGCSLYNKILFDQHPAAIGYLLGSNC